MVIGFKFRAIIKLSLILINTKIGFYETQPTGMCDLPYRVGYGRADLSGRGPFRYKKTLCNI